MKEKTCPYHILSCKGEARHGLGCIGFNFKFTPCLSNPSSDSFSEGQTTTRVLGKVIQTQPIM